MSSLQYSPVAGSEGANRATNVPTLSAMTAILAVRIPAYSDYVELFALGGVNNQQFYIVESDAAGVVSLHSDMGIVPAGQTSVVVTGSFTGWRVFIMRSTATVASCAYLAPGDATFTQVQHTYNAAVFATTSVSFVTTPLFPTDTNGSIQYGFQKVWAATLSDSECLRESRTIKPRRMTNLTYWNPCRAAGSDAGRDFSNTGGNFTITGAPAVQASNPDIPWQVAAQIP